MPTVRPRNGQFQAIVRVKRDRVLIHQESRMFATERLARDWGERVERQIKAEGVPARQRTMSTFADLIGKYRIARQEVRQIGRAMLGDLDMLERHLGAKRLSELSSAVWVDFARKRRQGAAGPATVLHNLSIARTVLNAAKPMFSIDVNGEAVSEAIKALSLTGHVAKSNERDRRASDAELERLYEEFRRTAGHPSTLLPMEKIVRIAVSLPRRIGELCDMRWLDYNAGLVTLRDTKHPRALRTETVPVPPAARAVIDALPRIDERILPYKSESVSAAFDRACDRVGIDDLHLHDLRHEGICRLFERGLSIPEVSKVSGHLSWNSLRRYTHLQPQDILEKMNETAP